jgi:hypothetical protein
MFKMQRSISQQRPAHLTNAEPLTRKEQLWDSSGGLMQFLRTI